MNIYVYQYKLQTLKTILRRDLAPGSKISDSAPDSLSWNKGQNIVFAKRLANHPQVISTFILWLLWRRAQAPSTGGKIR